VAENRYDHRGNLIIKTWAKKLPISEFSSILIVINLIITIGVLELYARLTQPIRPLLVVKQTIDKLVPLAESDPQETLAV
jgi:hypothetical protein